jgi:hypothetical protein
MRIPSYCSFSFLEELSKQANIDLMSIDDYDNAIATLQLQSLIREGLVLHTDVGVEKIEATLDNPLIKHLVKNQRIISSRSSFAELRSDQKAFLNREKKQIGVFLLSQTFSKEAVAGLQAASGNYCLNAAQSPATLFEEIIEDFSFREGKTWDFAQKLFDPHHSLVIADPYLFTKNSLDALLHFLEVVIPTTMQRPYNLSLIASNSRRNYNSTTSDIKTGLERIKKIVQSKNSNESIELYMYNGEDFHDRYLISNNVFIYSGTGIDILRRGKEAIKDSTWVAVKPFRKVSSGGKSGVFYYSLMQKKLEVLKKWLQKSGQPPSNNPLFQLN